MAALSAKAVASLPFQIKVPADYELIPQYKLRKMGAGLGDEQALTAALSKPKAKPEFFSTSVVFTKIPVQDVPATSKALCDFVASMMAKELGVKASPAKRVELPLGETCQFEMGGAERQANAVPLTPAAREARGLSLDPGSCEHQFLHRVHS